MLNLLVTDTNYILTVVRLTHFLFFKYQGILKPAYNRVDMMEVEVMDDENEPRNFSQEVIDLRYKIVMQEKGNITMNVKGHFDDMVKLL